jgi:hypothetical protein
MVKSVKLQSASVTQPQRLARKETLRAEIAKLERQIREVQEEIARLLETCEHTDSTGESALIGGRTKVCAHCGRVVTNHGEKLWG